MAENTQKHFQFLRSAQVKTDLADAKLAYVEKCNKMLNAMHSNLDTKKLTLTITATVTDRPTGA